MLRMEALDCAWWGGQDVCRLVVICRAIDDVGAEPDDKWMREGFISADFKPYGLNYHDLDSALPPVGYRSQEGMDFKWRKGMRLMDLFATVDGMLRYPINAEKASLRLTVRR